MVNFTAHCHLLVKLQTAFTLLCCDFLFVR